MNEVLKRDQNHITVLGGITNDIDQDVTMLRVDPITKRLLISADFSGLGFVPYTGATANVDLGTYDLITETITTNTGQSLSIVTDAGITMDAPNVVLRGGITFAVSNNGGSTLANLDTTSLMTTDRTFAFPDASGTLALIADVPTVSGTTNYVAKFTGTNSIGDSLIFDNGTNVGIGTATPSENLTIGSSVNGTNLAFGIRALGIAGASVRSIFTQDATTGALGLAVDQGVNGTSSRAFNLSVGSATNAFNVTGTGNVGIGTTSPAYTLDVNGVIAIPTQDTTTGVAKYIRVGTYGTISETAGGLSYITGNALRASQTVNNQIVKTSGDAGQFIGMRYDRGITFHTNLTGAAGTEYSDTANQRMVIDISGNVGINTPSPGAKLAITDDTDGSATILKLITSDGGLATNQELRTDWQQNTNVLSRQAFTYFGGSDYGFNFYGFNSVLNTTPIMTMRGSGNVGIGTTPTAVLHLKAGTATANTAPLKLTSGTNLTTPEAGAIEYDGNNIYHTTTSTARRSLVGALFTQTANKTVANTITETSIVGTGVGYGLTLPANFFVVGKTIKLRISGVYSTVAVTGDTITIKVKYGSTILATKATSGLLTGATNLSFWADLIISSRTTGVSGTVQVDGGITYQIAGSAAVIDEVNNGAATSTLDTTASGLLDITITHSAANASNTITSLVSTWEVIN